MTVITCPCCETKIDPAKATKPRSTPQHRRYFAMVKAAFFHWPESHFVQFADETECRKWLQMRAGWRDIAARLPITGMQPDRLKMFAEAAFKAAGTHAVPVVHKGELVIWVPRSIRFDRMPHQEFCALSDAVGAVIEQEAGLRTDQLLSEAIA
jgi:hypothetical protein